MTKLRTIETLQLDGGCLCFDFVNTVNERPVFKHDYLSSYAELLTWCQKANALPSTRIDTLEMHALDNKIDAQLALDKAKIVREALYTVFNAIQNKREVPATALNKVNLALNESFSNLGLMIKDDKLELDWKTTAISLDEPLWHIMKSCFDIWTTESTDRMKHCDRCGWLFLDKSKNKKRKWCNMQVCGSHDKALRYYYRMKEQ
jgi:predicted RNA-binding Zn ribbon-like protein